MSELINAQGRNESFRRDLLTNVSMLVLAGYLCASQATMAASADDSQPTVWIELGGQLERVNSAQTIFSPPFFDQASANVLAPMVDAQLPPKYSIGGEGKLTFAPSGSDWVFSASVRYGRSNATKHPHYESAHPSVPFTISNIVYPAHTLDRFGDGQSNLRASHVTVDFKAGKDVGLGLFGTGSTSVLSAGVRFAQFTSSSDVTLHARPIYGSSPPHGVPGSYSSHGRFLQNNTAVVQSRRSAQAIGPEVSWDASTPVARHDRGMTLAFDWGVNAAILFGRQRARVRHQTKGAYYEGFLAAYSGTVGSRSRYAHGPYDHDRSRTVTIPNVGGFAGVSFKYANAKLSFGYRGDFFFGAMDNGIDATKKSNVGFYGPFATISIGIGG